MKQLSVILVAFQGSLATAQIDDAQAIDLARAYVDRFAPEASVVAPSVAREMIGSVRGETLTIEVSYGEVFVRLSRSGEFKAFLNLSRDRPIEMNEPDKYPTDEEAWQALESILVDFEVPSGLTRTELVRNAPGGMPYVMRFRMLPRPYGYEVDGGNGVSAEMHQKTGRLNSLRVTRGWTYEPPNIRISREQAVETTRRTYGGEPEDWQVNLRYRSFARAGVPEYVRALSASKTKRLFYALWGPRGEVRIDSTNGEIVEFISPDQVASTHDKRGRPDGSGGDGETGSASVSSALTKNEPANPPGAAGAPKGASKASTPDRSILLLVAGALVIVAGTLVLLRRGRATP